MIVTAGLGRTLGSEVRILSGQGRSSKKQHFVSKLFNQYGGSGANSSIGVFKLLPLSFMLPAQLVKVLLLLLVTFLDFLVIVAILHGHHNSFSILTTKC